MTAAYAEANFSELVNRPREVLSRLSGTRGLLLHRRDAEDLVVTTAERAGQEAAVLGVISRTLSALASHEDGHSMLSQNILPEAFPWVRFLPDDAIPSFIDELITTLRAADDLENTAALATLLSAWKHTAEVYADPDLLETLTRDLLDDFGPVPDPLTARRNDELEA